MTNTAVNRIGFPESVNTMGNNTAATLYPNPVTDVLTINTGSNAFHTIEISNAIGQVMITQQI